MSRKKNSDEVSVVVDMSREVYAKLRARASETRRAVKREAEVLIGNALFPTPPQTDATGDFRFDKNTTRSSSTTLNPRSLET